MTRLTLITKCGNAQQNRINYNQLTFCFSEIKLSDSIVDNYAKIEIIFSVYFCSTHTDCGVFGGWPYLAYQYIEQTVSL